MYNSLLSREGMRGLLYEVSVRTFFCLMNKKTILFNVGVQYYFCFKDKKRYNIDTFNYNLRSCLVLREGK